MVENFYGSPPKTTQGAAKGRDSLMIFHKTDNSTNPGVGDYTIAGAGLEVRRTEPRATIGKETRFVQPKMREYLR